MSEDLPQSSSPAEAPADAGHVAPVEAPVVESLDAPEGLAGDAVDAPHPESTEDGADADADAVAEIAAAGSTPASSPSARAMSPAECADKLKALFPALFTGGAKPLKLKIQADIQERAPGVFSKQAMSGFFRRHTGSTSYLIALTRAQHRFDLDGQPAGDIAEEHRKAALEELGRRRANQDDRRALEDQQRRNRATLLRDFDTTTLTRANFCALKGVAEADLDGFLATAREEAASAPPPRQEPQGRPPHRGRPHDDAGRHEGGRNDRPRTDRPRNEPARTDRPQENRQRETRPPRPRNP